MRTLVEGRSVLAVVASVLAGGVWLALQLDPIVTKLLVALGAPH